MTLGIGNPHSIQLSYVRVLFGKLFCKPSGKKAARLRCLLSQKIAKASSLLRDFAVIAKIIAVPNCMFRSSLPTQIAFGHGIHTYVRS